MLLVNDEMGKIYEKYVVKVVLMKNAFKKSSMNKIN